MTEYAQLVVLCATDVIEFETMLLNWYEHFYVPPADNDP